MKKIICSFVYIALGMMVLTSCAGNDDNLGDIKRIGNATFTE